MKRKQKNSVHRALITSVWPNRWHEKITSQYESMMVLLLVSRSHSGKIYESSNATVTSLTARETVEFVNNSS